MARPHKDEFNQDIQDIQNENIEIIIKVDLQG